MSAAQHTPQGAIEIALHIGQHVRQRDHLGQRVTGTVRGLSLDSDRVLQADITLDAPIIIPALNADDREISIWHQHVPAHELAPFDARDELIEGMLSLLRRMEEQYDDNPTVGLSLFIDDIRATIAKASGGSA